MYYGLLFFPYLLGTYCINFAFHFFKYLQPAFYQHPKRLYSLNLKIKTKKQKLKLKHVPWPKDCSTSLLSLTAKLLVRIVCRSHQFLICLYSSTYSNLVPTFCNMKPDVIRHIKNHTTTKILLTFSGAMLSGKAVFLSFLWLHTPLSSLPSTSLVIHSQPTLLGLLLYLNAIGVNQGWDLGLLHPSFVIFSPGNLKLSMALYVPKILKYISPREVWLLGFR